ncbi:TRAP transporter large permease [Acuticoccus sediminis]|uniref:TRAP transporter large permease protein n=1 Tax=Acuticoccus sediminis TaxID=2184697 RepID=A0A8B2NQA6_9HYPH|nr:TRAP transporter large permease [Acuticoccus sediminis]RAI02075.1 TRAP transporter large permease [Acuticoccus sediminis]
MTALILVGTMVLLALLGVRLVFAIIIASVVALLVYRPNIPFAVVAQQFLSGIDNFLLLAVAFFFLAGELMNRGGVTRRIVAFAQTCVGHIRGGLGHVNVLSSVFFSGISGSAVADTAAVGSVMIPAMEKSGFSRGFAAAITQTSSVIGPIIPPSIPMIVYAVLAQVSVGKMFLAGIVPGLVVALCLMAVVYVISVIRNYPSDPWAGFGAIARAGAGALVALLTPVIIVGGILGGIMTATEAGAVAVAYAFVVGKFWFRELTWGGCFTALVEAAKGTATVLVIVGASALFAWIVADLKVSTMAAEAIFSITRDPFWVLVLVMLFVLVIGLFLDPLAALVIVVPVFLPTMVSLGIDPIHFGVLIVLNLMIGLTTPPVGYLIYLSAYIARERPEVVIRESLPFLAALIVALLICLVFPAVVLTLPNLYSGG